MTTYNGRKLHRQRARRKAWDTWQPVVLTALLCTGAACVWWLARLAGLV